MTVQEQRAEILKKLWWLKKEQDEKQTNDEYPIVISRLYRTIRKVRGMEPVGYGIGNLSTTGYLGAMYKYPKYSDEDEAILHQIVDRMEEQGFIKIQRVNGRRIAIKVLKTK